MGNLVSVRLCIGTISLMRTIWNTVHVISDMNAIHKIKTFKEHLRELKSALTTKPNAQTLFIFVGKRTKFRVASNACRKLFTSSQFIFFIVNCYAHHSPITLLHAGTFSYFQHNKFHFTSDHYLSWNWLRNVREVCIRAG